MNIKIINIYEEFRKIKVIEKNNNEEIIYDFIYPASYMEHKNHKILIDTLIDLSKQNIFPKVLITLDEKEEFACNQYPNKSKPNTKFVYHSSDTFLLGLALNNLLKERDENESYARIYEKREYNIKKTCCRYGKSRSKTP